MTTTYAAAEDVRTRWGRAELSPEEVALVNLRLTEVERMIKRRIPDLDIRVAADEIDAEDVIQIESDAVLRLLRNPEGYISETDGDYSYMLQHGRLSGRLFVTPEEWAVLGLRRGVAVLAPSFGGGK